jgi:hypothetical protein
MFELCNKRTAGLFAKQKVKKMEKHSIKLRLGWHFLRYHDSMVKTNTDLREQADKFLDNGGSILGCGTCLRSRNNKEPQVCSFSSLAELYSLIRKNKIVLTHFAANLRDMLVLLHVGFRWVPVCVLRIFFL